MKIATFNVNGVNGRLETLLGWLALTKPDVVCLQELKTSDERFPVAALAEAGYSAVWRGQKSWNGVAILARGMTPVETRRSLPGDPADVQSRYLEAAVGGVLIACLYAPNGNPVSGPTFAYKLRWFERLLAHAENMIEQKHPVILVGDFNIIPADEDVYRPERWRNDALFRPEVRDIYRRLLAQGWSDSLRLKHPGERIYTFWDYFRNAWGRDAGLRLDHMLIAPPLVPRLRASGVDRDVRGWPHASDHAPVWIELDGPATPARP